LTYSKIERDPITNSNFVLVFSLIALLFILTGWFIASAQLRPIINPLTTTVVNLPQKGVRTPAGQPVKLEQTTWKKRLKAGGIVLYIKCVTDTVCNKGLRVKIFPTAGVVVMLSGLFFVVCAVITNMLLLRPRDKLDTARWLRANEMDHPEVGKFLDGERDAEGNITEPVIVHLGYVIEPMGNSNVLNPDKPVRYKTTGVKRIGITSKMLQEHVLVYGPTGTGKTSRVLHHFFLAFAKRGDAVMVVDFKYPRIVGGFSEMIVLFRRMGNPVYPILPYEMGGYHIPVFDYIQTHQQGRDLAAQLIPEAEYKSTDSAFYKQTQQIILGSVFKVVAKSPTPNFKEVIRIIQMPQVEFIPWLEGSGDDEAKATLSRFLTDPKGKDWNSFVTGILNALEPFDDPMVTRTFTSVEGRNFDVEEWVMNGGLLYFGTGLDRMMTPRGKVITRVVDAWVTNRIVKLRTEVSRTGPQKSVRKMFDEAFAIGRLQALLDQTAVFRDSEISLILGMQNENQMEIIYDETVWAAITANLATRIILPTGFQDQAAITLSRYLGEREIPVRVKSESSGAGGMSAQMSSSRKGSSVVIQKRPQVTLSELGEWPYFMGILQTKGTLPPALIATVPLYDPKPSYYGLDNRKFTIDNRVTYEEWTEIMEEMSPEERAAEVKRYINESLTEEDHTKPLNNTLRDVFNDWIRFAISDGASFRRGNSQTFDVLYPSLHASLRGEHAERTLKAFQMFGWLKVPSGLEDAQQEWGWINITKLGIETLGQFAVKELNNVRYASLFIQERKHAQEASPSLGARYEEAKEVLPYEAARRATLLLLKTFDAVLEPAVLEKAADLLMERFETVDKAKQLVGIPLSMPFERLCHKVIAQAQGDDEDKQELSWDDRLLNKSAGRTVSLDKPALPEAAAAEPTPAPSPAPTVVESHTPETMVSQGLTSANPGDAPPNVPFQLPEVASMAPEDEDQEDALLPLPGEGPKKNRGRDNLKTGPRRPSSAVEQIEEGARQLWKDARPQGEVQEFDSAPPANEVPASGARLEAATLEHPEPSISADPADVALLAPVLPAPADAPRNEPRIRTKRDDEESESFSGGL